MGSSLRVREVQNIMSNVYFVDPFVGKRREQETFEEDQEDEQETKDLEPGVQEPQEEQGVAHQKEDYVVQVLRKRKRNMSEEGGGNPQQRKSKAKIRITEYTPVTR